MAAVPATLERLALPGERRLAAGGECLVPFQAREGNEAVEHVEEKKAHPDAGADVAATQRVDTVVPVAGPQERQPVRAEMRESEPDREARMLVDGRALARD